MIATANSPIISYTLDRIRALRATTTKQSIRTRCDIALNPMISFKVRWNAITNLVAALDAQ